MTQQGTRIGPYALEVQVGRTAGCSIWHAVRADGKARGPSRVVIRLLDDPGDTRATARMELEYKRLKAIDGAGAPHAVALYAGFGALAMEQKRGATLRSLLDAMLAATLALDPTTALEVALGTARVLRHAHQLPDGLVHGRLGPSDILLGGDSSITLMGWGGWSPQVWSPGIAPEVLKGQPPTPWADMYALGAVLATMLEPKLAHEQGLGAACHRTTMNWPAAGRLLEQLLASDPAGRFPDLGPVIHEILALARHKGGVARVGELAERCASFRRSGITARAMQAASLEPAAPVAPIPAIVPPPKPPPQSPPASTKPLKSATTPPPKKQAPAREPTPAPSGTLPRPVPPRPQANPPSVSPSPEPSPKPDDRPVPQPAPPAKPPPVAVPKPADEPEPSPEREPLAPLDEEDEITDHDGSSMQLMERVALALVGLLLMGILAWVGRSCLGG